MNNSVKSKWKSSDIFPLLFEITAVIWGKKTKHLNIMENEDALLRLN